MTEFLLQFGISNLCISLALAIVAWAVHTTSKQPFVAYLLWLLVLAKLVTPPIVTVPVVPVPGLTANASGTAATLADRSGIEATTTSMLIPAQGADETRSRVDTAALVEGGKTGLVLLWVFGSACVFAWTLVRIYRFNRLLKMASKVAPPELQRVASQTAQRLGLKPTPTIYTTSARLSPMVWWLGGRVRILIPAALPREVDAGQLRWILAHELAHVRRRDHLVRWLEWLACVCFWWNPVAWWARRNLRINEEICCDALVLSSLQPKPHTYANSLMTVVEFLASPAIRPPAMASEMNSGGFLERRFRMIVSSSPIPNTSRWLHAGILLMALTLLPLGVAYAQDRDPGVRPISDDVSARDGERSEEDCEALGLRLKEMVENGDLTREEAGEQYSAACEKDAGIEGDYKKLGVDDEVVGRIRNHLAENGFTDEQIEQTLGGMVKVVYEMREEGEDFELDPRILDYFENDVGLGDEQIELVQGIARRVLHASGIEGHFKRLGMGDEVVGRIRNYLTENGLTDEQVEQTLGGMVRVVYEMGEEGEEFELDPRMRDYLENEVGLVDEQIELVQGLAQRLASRPADDTRRRIIRALMDNGIARENVEGVMGTLRPIIGEIQREGDAFELDPQVHEQLVGMGLTDEQIDYVVGLAQRRASRRADDDSGRGDARSD